MTFFNLFNYSSSSSNKLNTFLSSVPGRNHSSPPFTSSSWSYCWYPLPTISSLEANLCRQKECNPTWLTSLKWTSLKGEVNQKIIFSEMKVLKKWWIMLFKFLKTHFWFSKYFNVNIGIYRSEIWPAKVLIRTGSKKYYDVAESRKKYFMLTISNILQFNTDFRDF